MTAETAYRKRTTCRYCESNHVTKFLSLGKHPPSNSFIQPDKIAAEQRYPLDLYICDACYLVQLMDVVPPEIIFDDYLYLSSSSKALKKHYADLASTITRRFKLTKGDVVVDIGCNDGILLHGYKKSDLVLIGIEPSKIAKIAEDSGLEVMKEFFTKKTALSITKKYGKAKIATATNVFAHVDDIKTFVSGLPVLLADDGVFIIEVPYLLDMVVQTIFDTIYHEHQCYLSLTPMVPFLSKFGLEIFDVERIPFGASGPAIRVYIGKIGKKKILNSVTQLLSSENKWGVTNIARYKRFAVEVKRVKLEILEIINNLRKTGIKIGGYGAPAKGNTLLNYFGITKDTITCIADTNPLKQGLLTPGSHIPIVSEEVFLENMPEYALLLSWNYLDFFLENSAYIKKGGKFLVPIPKPRIVP